MAERHASNVDVAGSLPVGRSISEAIVRALLEDDEVGDFLDRHAEAIHADDIINALDTCGLAHDRIEHIEILPFNDTEGFCVPNRATNYRLDVYGVQRGKIDGNFYHIRAFSTFEQAVAAAKVLQGILGELEISFEGKPVTESDDVDDFLDRNSEQVGLDLINKNLRDSGFSNRWHLVDGIEIYGMVNDPDHGQLRVDDQPPEFYGVSLHVQNAGLYDVGDFATADQALQVARFLRKKIPHKVHWIDEVTPL